MYQDNPKQNNYDKTYIRHIIEATSAIEIFMKDVDYKSFIKNDLLQSAVMRKLEIIGEASKRLSKEFKREQNRIPWKEICGMRDKLIHDYFGVDLMAVWKTAIKDVMSLKEILKKL